MAAVDLPSTRKKKRKKRKEKKNKNDVFVIVIATEEMEERSVRLMAVLPLLLIPLPRNRAEDNGIKEIESH